VDVYPYRVRARRHRAWWVLAVAGSGAACNLLTGVSNLDETPGEESDAGHARKDATPPQDASRVDTSIGDAGPPFDHVASDAEDVPIQMRSNFCALLDPPPILCADFDEGSLDGGWAQVGLNGGTVVLDPTQFVSPPASMIASILPATSGYPFAVLSKNFTEAIGNSRFAFDFELVTIDSCGEYAKFVSLTLPNPESTPFALFVQLASSDGGLLIVEQDPVDGGADYPSYSLVDSFPAGVWGHLEIDTIAAPDDGGISQYQVSLNDASVLPPTAVQSTWAFGAPSIGVGIVGANTPGGACVVRFDNVTFDLE
jgi:hypothetical protein